MKFGFFQDSVDLPKQKLLKRALLEPDDCETARYIALTSQCHFQSDRLLEL